MSRKRWPVFVALTALLIEIVLALGWVICEQPQTPLFSIQRVRLCDIHFESLLYLLGIPTGGIFALFASIAIADGVSTTRNRRHDTPEKLVEEREQLRVEMQSRWIEGMLRPKLRALTLKLPYDALRGEHRYDSDAGQRVLEDSAAVHEAFNAIGYGKSLLILGAPGGGKTVTMLQLAERLIVKEAAKVPIVFNLSSWGAGDEILYDWLLVEFERVYNIREKTARRWLDGEHLTLLLDGLDEVKHNQRGQCAEAIDAFLSDHGLTPLVVCCREEEYRLLVNTGHQLTEVSGMIHISLLSETQVNTVLDNPYLQLAAIQQVMAQDEELSKLARIPLFLNMMAAAYRGESADQLRQRATQAAWRKEIFDRYITNQFAEQKRKTAEQHAELPYSEADTRRWLNWLANQLHIKKQPLLFIELLQYDWLVSERLQKRYKLIARLPRTILFSLVGGVLGWAIAGLTGVLAAGLVAFVLGLVLFTTSPYIVPTPKVNFNIPKMLIGIAIGLVTGMVLWPVFLILLPLLQVTEWTSIWSTNVWLSLLLICGSIFALGGMLWGIEKVDFMIPNRPNANMFRMFKNATIIVLIGLMFVFVSDIAPFVRTIGGYSPTPYSRLINNFITLLAFVIASPLNIILKHIILRVMLTRAGHMPPNYAKFLDYAARLVFLYKVGGGYTFIHDLFRDHFAEMEVGITNH